MKIMSNKKFSQYVIFFVFVFFATIILFVKFAMAGVSHHIYDMEKVVVDVEQTAEHEMSFEFPIKKELIGKYICFFTEDSFVTATVDGYEVYKFGRSTSFCESPGSQYQFIQFPNIPDSTMLITIKSVSDVRLVSNFDVYIGGFKDMSLYLLRQDSGNILFCCIFLICGIILLFIDILNMFVNSSSNGNTYIGILSLLFGLFCACDSVAIQFLFIDLSCFYFVFYFLIFLLPICLIAYIECLLNKSCKVELLICCGSSIIMTILHLIGIVQLTSTLPIFLGIIILCLVILTIKFIKAKAQTKIDRPQKIAFAFMIIAFFINIVSFIVKTDSVVNMHLIDTGLLVYVISCIKVGVDLFFDTIRQIDEAEMLEKIAYSDELTGLGNRRAFERTIDKIDVKNLAVTSFDLNNLKYYNDVCGHKMGDKLIKEASKIMKDVYESIYRTGGDEFIYVDSNLTIDELEAKKIMLQAKLKKYNAKVEDGGVILEIAIGNAVYEDGDMSFDDIFSRADKLMYEDKNIIKNQSPLPDVRKIAFKEDRAHKIQ